jgi:cob(I)alamin adenosyltransferase
MKIYTRKGDTGTTQLIGGTRVAKHSLRIECYGTVDELNSYLGCVRDQVNDEHDKFLLKEIQDRLFTIGSSLASDPEKSRMKIPDLHESDIDLLEQEMDKMTETLPELRSFILPGGHFANSICHVARCVCRRAERLVSDLNETEKTDPLVLKYLNRLSDYLFVLSRKISKDFGAEEIEWKPRV